MLGRRRPEHVPPRSPGTTASRGGAAGHPGSLPSPSPPVDKHLREPRLTPSDLRGGNIAYADLPSRGLLPDQLVRRLQQRRQFVPGEQAELDRALAAVSPRTVARGVAGHRRAEQLRGDDAWPSGRRRLDQYAPLGLPAGRNDPADRTSTAGRGGSPSPGRGSSLHRAGAGTTSDLTVAPGRLSSV